MNGYTLIKASDKMPPISQVFSLKNDVNRTTLVVTYDTLVNEMFWYDLINCVYIFNHKKLLISSIVSARYKYPCDFFFAMAFVPKVLRAVAITGPPTAYVNARAALRTRPPIYIAHCVRAKTARPVIETV